MKLFKLFNKQESKKESDDKQIDETILRVMESTSEAMENVEKFRLRMNGEDKWFISREKKKGDTLKLKLECTVTD